MPSELRVPDAPVVLILNGPNLNLLGRREPEIYGHTTLEEIGRNCVDKAGGLGLRVDFRQSNHEGELVEWIQQAVLNEGVRGIIINAAAYTHTSVAIHDALKMFDRPVVEVHLSDPKQRESFRHFSFITSVAAHEICGQGAQGYDLALEWLAQALE